VIERDALLVRYDNAEGTIVVCHGFMCDKTDVGILRQIFGPGRFNILSFDFRAHGKKVAGQCCTFGRDEANEVRAAAHFVKSHPALKDKPLFLYGFSMGAVAGIEAQSKDPSLFSAMILDCPFSSSAEVVSRGLDTMLFSVLGYKFKMPGRSLLQQYLFHPYVQSLVQVTLKTVAGMNPKNININICSISPKESVKKISVPAFFILCKQDERVSVDAIKSLYNNVASNYKELWLTNGRFHFDSLFHNPERYKDKVQSFLDKAVTGKLAATKEQTITEDDEDELL
jgi:pimeloyl-ACP methyl ester carboxylesterase